MKPFSLMLILCLEVGNAFIYAQEAKDSSTAIIAVVLGKKITVEEKDNLRRLIFAPLLEQFVKDNHLEPTEQEMNTYFTRMKELQMQLRVKLEEDKLKLLTELKDTTLTEQQRSFTESRLLSMEERLKTWSAEEEEQTVKINDQELQMMIGFVKNWKINKALYDKYGGRVMFQQIGPEPIDAYLAFLKEQEKNGAFQILDRKYEPSFWEYFISEKNHFYSKEEGEKFINTPFWMMQLPNDF